MTGTQKLKGSLQPSHTDESRKQRHIARGSEVSLVTLDQLLYDLCISHETISRANADMLLQAYDAPTRVEAASLVTQ